MTKTVVKLIGFDLTFASGINIDDFFHHLVISENNSIKAGGYQNYVIANLHKNYIVGVLLCYKGDKRLLATRNVNEELEIDKIELSDDQQSTQASIFCLEPVSKSGMFYSYHGGVSITNFAKVLKSIHDTIKKAKIKEKSRELSKLKSPSKKNQKDSRTAYIGDFSLNIKVREHDINTLISSFSDFSACEINLTPAVQLNSKFRALSNVASGYRTYVPLNGAKSADDKRNALQAVWDQIKHKDEIKGLKIWGKALTGAALDAKIGENIQHYQEMYLDDYIDLLPDSTWSKYTESEALENIVKVMRDQPLVFPAPPSDRKWKTLLNKKDIAKTNNSRTAIFESESG